MKPFTYALSTLLIAALLIQTGTAKTTGTNPSASRYNVIWNTPSKDATGVMPIGNGDIAAGVYAIENDDFYLLLAKNDAYNYLGDIFKTGRVRISLNPNPFKTGMQFKQTLDLATGSIRIEANGVAIRIWADANSPVFHAEVSSPTEISVTVKPELWKRIDCTVFNLAEFNGVKFYPSAAGEPSQDVKLERNGKILWYFPVGDRSIYNDDLKYYGVEKMSAKFPDPFRFNTFGNLLESPQLSLNGGALTGKGINFDIRIHEIGRAHV